MSADRTADSPRSSATNTLDELVARVEAIEVADAEALAWVAVLRASVANGNDLLHEARVLDETCSSPRAFALAVLAAEEFGKAIRAFLVLNSGGDAEEIADFERTYRHHQTKLEAGGLWSSLLHGVEMLHAGLAEQVRGAAKAAAGKKMDAFYVDRRPDGSLGVPSATVGSEDVERALDTATVLSQSVTQVAALLDTDQKVQMFWTLGPEINARLDAAMLEEPELRDQIVYEIRGLLPSLGITAE